VRTRRSDALRGRAFTGQTQYATRACTRSVCFKTERLSSVPINRFSQDVLGKFKLFVDEPPLVTSHDIDAHRHCDGLLGHARGFSSALRLVRADTFVGPLRQEIVPLGGREIAAGDLTREALPRWQVHRPCGDAGTIVDHQVTAGSEMGNWEP
jgi:hypothetical protein